MRTLFTAYRVSDLERSLAFYAALGYRILGRVPLSGGARLVVLSFPGEPVATLELVHRPGAVPVEVGGFDHLAIQVDDVEAAVSSLRELGLEPGPVELPGGSVGPRLAWLEDPDGYRIELVEWPADHPAGLTAADFQESHDRGGDSPR